MRILNFDDGFYSSTEPTKGTITPANKILEFANDSAYVLAKGTAATDSDIYFNTTTKTLRLFANAEWTNQVRTDASGNVNIDNNLTIQGDLTIHGDTVSVNATNLEVTDKNITVNKDGTDFSAEGAGITVQRETGDGSLVYDKDAVSKWKLGNVGTEKEVVDVSSTQALSNKEINASENTITNITNAAIKSDAAIDFTKMQSLTSNKVAITLATGKIGAHTLNQSQLDYLQPVTGTLTENAKAQILTNKDIEGGAASDTSRIVIPKGTAVDINSLDPKEASLVFNTDDKKLYVCDGDYFNFVGTKEPSSTNMTSNMIDFSKEVNYKQLTSNSSFIYVNETPCCSTTIVIFGDTVDRTITLPSGYIARPDLNTTVKANKINTYTIIGVEVASVKKYLVASVTDMEIT